MGQYAVTLHRARKRKDELAVKYTSALIEQYGSIMKGIAAPLSTENPHTRAAHDMLDLAIVAYNKARSDAFANGGDFAMTVEEAKQEGVLP